MSANCPDKKKVHAVDQPEAELELDGLLMINSIDEVMAVDKPKDKTYKVRIGVDSGAAVSVLRRASFPDYPVIADESTALAIALG